AARGPRFPGVSPTYRMLDAATRRREAELAEVARALAGARCAARLAGLGTGEFVVRELLLGVIEEINRAERAVVSLISTRSRDGVARRPRLRDAPSLLLELGVSHAAQDGDALRHRRMGRERVGEETFARRQAPSQRVGDAEVRRAALDGRGRRHRTFDLLERARQREWVAGELGAHGIGQILALTAHRQREDLRDDRRE